ncbi:MAG: hypothetical protein GY701_07075 [Sulfitobacter sp.]|nr:hypothetical protein [Sulfitobacter sp.]
MIDSDMTWEPEDVYTLLETADASERPIVGGLAFAGGRGTDLYPTIFDLQRDDKGFLTTNPITDYPKDSLIKVGATGAAFLLVHQWVIREMGKAFAKQADGSVNPYPWFVEGVDAKGAMYGEDVGFCRNAQAMGVPVHVHTGVSTGHIKHFELNEALWDERRAAGYKTPKERGIQGIQLQSKNRS